MIRADFLIDHKSYRLKTMNIKDFVLKKVF